MAYGTTRKTSSSSGIKSSYKGKSLSEMTKEEKEQRAKDMNAAASVNTRKTKYANPKRGERGGSKPRATFKQSKWTCGPGGCLSPKNE
jgi:hypothetical protein